MVALSVDSTGEFRHLLKALVYLSLGVGLVLSPAFFGAVHGAFNPGDTYGYEAVEITPDGRSLQFESASARSESASPRTVEGLDSRGIEGIDCVDWPTRLCEMERVLLLGNGTVHSESDPRQRTPRYVWLDRELYERVNDRSGNGTVMRLEPVSGAAVLKDVSVPVERSADPTAARRIVDEGNATFDRPLEEPGRIVEVNGSYYAFSLSARKTTRDSVGRWPAALVIAAAFVTGLWALRRGWVHYDWIRGERTTR